MYYRPDFLTSEEEKKAEKALDEAVIACNAITAEKSDDVPFENKIFWVQDDDVGARRFRI